MKFKSKNLREIAECIIGDKITLIIKVVDIFQSFLRIVAYPLCMMVQHVGLGHQTD